MYHGRLYFSIFLIILAALLTVIVISQKQKRAPITDFKQCVAAGYPVMESFPRQCTLPGGKFFVEQSVRER